MPYAVRLEDAQLNKADLIATVDDPEIAVQFINVHLNATLAAERRILWLTVADDILAGQNRSMKALLEEMPSLSGLLDWHSPLEAMTMIMDVTPLARTIDDVTDYHVRGVALYTVQEEG